jgi:predicted RNA-binding protein with PUA-like domain
VRQHATLDVAAFLSLGYLSSFTFSVCERGFFHVIPLYTDSFGLRHRPAITSRTRPRLCSFQGSAAENARAAACTQPGKTSLQTTEHWQLAIEDQTRSENPMSSDYLLKTEPSEYSFADLQRDAVTVWDGVSNPVALRNLREMTPGARLVIYETGARKCAVGTASVVSVDLSNPKNPAVKIKAGNALAKPVTLAEIKSNPLFSASPLVRQGRLSVVPLTNAQYKALTGN